MATTTTTLNLKDGTFVVHEHSTDGTIRCTWQSVDGTILAYLTPEGARRLAEAAGFIVT